MMNKDKYFNLVDLGLNDKNLLNQEIWISLLFCILIGWKQFIGTAVSFIDLPYHLEKYTLYLLFIIIIVLSFKNILQRLSKETIFLVLILSIFLCISMLLQNEYMGFFIMLGKSIFLICIPYYIVARCVRDYNSLYKWLGYLAIMLTACEAIIQFATNYSLEGYSQYRSYLVYPAAIISLDYLFRRFSVVHVLNFIAAIGFIFFSGARGPIICIILYFAIKVIMTVKNHPKKIFVTVSITTAISYLYINYFEHALVAIRSTAINMEWGVRLIDRIIYGNFFEDFGRENLLTNSFSIIAQHPLTGVGILNDRISLVKLVGANLDPIGYYPHNIFVELVMQFGIIFGIILLAALLFLVAKVLFGDKYQSNYVSNTASIVIGIGLLPLLFSDSYVTSPNFYLCFGILVSVAISRTKSIKLQNSQGGGNNKKSDCKN